MKHRILPVLAGLAVAFIFGFSFLFTKEALQWLNPFELLAHRFSLAAVFLLALAAARLIKVRFSWRLFWDLLPLALFQPVFYFLGETFGIKMTSASESGLIIALIPVAVAFLGRGFLGEKVGPNYWIYIWLSIAGVGLTVVANSGLRFGGHLLGISVLLAAVISAAFYNIWSRRLSRSYSPVEITTAMMLVGAIVFNLYYALFAQSRGGNYFAAFGRVQTLTALFYLGILSSVGAFFLLNYMLKQLPAVKTAAFVNLTTVVTVAAGVLFRGEPFGLLHLAGAILILIGVWGTTAG